MCITKGFNLKIIKGKMLNLLKKNLTSIFKLRVIFIFWSIFHRKLQILACNNTKEPKYIVTLTSYGYRVKEILPCTLYSLFSQSELPDRIVLYLDSWSWNEDNIPEELKVFKNKGLDIRYNNEVIKSYKKLIPALKEFSNDMLITADDDCYYPKHWLKKIKERHLKEPDKIICCSAHEIVLDSHMMPLPYLRWKQRIKKIHNENLTFPLGVYGILYPPKSLNKLITNSVEFMSLAPNADDIWFWAMAKLNRTKYSLVNVGRILPISLEEQQKGLFAENARGGNDEQLKNILSRFPEIVIDPKI